MRSSLKLYLIRLLLFSLSHSSHSSLSRSRSPLLSTALPLETADNRSGAVGWDCDAAAHRWIEQRRGVVATNKHLNLRICFKGADLQSIRRLRLIHSWNYNSVLIRQSQPHFTRIHLMPQRLSDQIQWPLSAHPREMTLIPLLKFIFTDTACCLMTTMPLLFCFPYGILWKFSNLPGCCPKHEMEWR